MSKVQKKVSKKDQKKNDQKNVQKKKDQIVYLDNTCDPIDIVVSYKIYRYIDSVNSWDYSDEKDLYYSNTDKYLVVKEDHDHPLEWEGRCWCDGTDDDIYEFFETREITMRVTDIAKKFFQSNGLQDHDGSYTHKIKKYLDSLHNESTKSAKYVQQTIRTMADVERLQSQQNQPFLSDKINETKIEYIRMKMPYEYEGYDEGKVAGFRA